MTTNAIEALLDEFDVAAITGVSVASIRRWRLLRTGPKFLKLGASVRYRPQDIRHYIDRLAGAQTPEEAA